MPDPHRDAASLLLAEAERLRARCARLAAYILADDDAEYVASFGTVDEIKARQAAAWAARRKFLPGDLSHESPDVRINVAGSNDG